MTILDMNSMTFNVGPLEQITFATSNYKMLRRTSCNCRPFLKRRLEGTFGAWKTHSLNVAASCGGWWVVNVNVLVLEVVGQSTPMKTNVQPQRCPKMGLEDQIIFLLDMARFGVDIGADWLAIPRS